VLGDTGISDGRVQMEEVRLWFTCARLAIGLCGAILLTSGISAVDCNRNGLADSEDIASLTSDDCDGDGVLDECEFVALGLGIYGEGRRVADRVVAAAAADLSGDGRDDLVLAAVEPGGASEIFALLSGTDRDFAPAAVYDAGEGLTALVTADFDVDGDMDVAATHKDGVNFFENLGDGVLGATLSLATAGTSDLLEAVDMDGDGRTDLVVATSPERSVEILANRETGTFEALGVFPFDVRPEDMISTDIDGDGDVDVGILNRRGATVSLLFNDSGVLSVPTVIEIPGRSPFDLVAADFNGDGQMDLAAATLRGISVLFGVGDGTFPSQTVLQLPPSSLTTVDVNGDGAIDLLVGSSSSNLVTALVNSGRGAFGPTAVSSSAKVTWRPGRVSPGDFDGDGDVDIAVTDRNSDGLNVLWNGESAMATVGFTRIGPDVKIGFKPHGAVQGDFNEDGVPDVATSNGHDRGVSFLFGTGTGTFHAPTVEEGTTYVFVGAGHLNHLTAGDFDGDAHLDVAAADREQNRIGILRNRGDGTFETEVHFPAGNRAYHVQAADLDGDGDLDLGVANAAANSVSLLTNAGDGTFGEQQTLRVETQPECIRLADLDGDGDIDVVVANRVAASLSLFFRQADGTYAAAPILPTLGAAISVTLADFDVDGDLDLASINETETEAFLNTGAGTMERGGLFPHSAPLGQPPFSVESDDINADGWPDVITANFNGGTVSILLSKGDGTFHAPFTLSAGEIVRATVTADFDGDGDIDLLATNRLDNNVTVFHNELQKHDIPNPLPPSECGELLFRRGDGNADGESNLSDSSFILNYLFLRGEVPTCTKSADVNDSGRVDILDPIHLVEFLFRSGPAPATPFESCGSDSTDDPLSCIEASDCR
jgi:hypothetical protein